MVVVDAFVVHVRAYIEVAVYGLKPPSKVEGEGSRPGPVKAQGECVCVEAEAWVEYR